MGKLIQLMGTLLIRHARDLAALQHQNCHIFFLHAGPDGIISSILNQSWEWKKNERHDCKFPLRQHLLLHILKITMDRAQKIQRCENRDKLLEASVNPSCSWGSELARKGFGDQWEATFNSNEGHAPASEDPDGPLSRRWSHSQVPLPTSIQPGECDPLQTGRGCEVPQVACADREAGSIQPLAADPWGNTNYSRASWQISSNKHFDPKPRRTNDADDEWMPSDHHVDQQKCGMLCELCVLDCLLGSPSLCETIHWWMADGYSLLRLLCGGSHQTVDLKTHGMLQAGMLQWQQLRSGGQQDFSEFWLSCLGGWTPKWCPRGLRNAISQMMVPKQSIRGQTYSHCTCIHIVGPACKSAFVWKHHWKLVKARWNADCPDHCLLAGVSLRRLGHVRFQTHRFWWLHISVASLYIGKWHEHCKDSVYNGFCCLKGRQFTAGALSKRGASWWYLAIEEWQWPTTNVWWYSFMVCARHFTYLDDEDRSS